jgi:hypothetical protein
VTTAAVTTAAVSFPLWCANSDGGVSVAGSRTEACRISGLLLSTFEIIDGEEILTGELHMDVYEYTYGAVDLPTWIHQIGVAPDPVGSWGAALNSTVTGTLSVAGSCLVNGATSFPVQSLSPPNLILRVGVAGAKTTATTSGTVGSCDTTWHLVVTAAGYAPATASETMTEIRCDNATGANGFRPARVGCVVPWYPAQVLYSQSAYPSLASHVSRAQGSGLPGAGFNNPLRRLTFPAGKISDNRQLACGDAPSIPGKSCDEYPLATTYSGLAFGGTRRSFDGCLIEAPPATGSSGASACMITASENHAQGGIMAAFYYDNRVLGQDPFRVGIGP